MNLKIKDRLVIGNLFPQRAGLLEQITVRDITTKVLISSEERKKLDLVQDGTTFKWSQDKDKGKEIEFSSIEIVFLKEQVDRMDKEKAITPELVELCVKIKESK